MINNIPFHLYCTDTDYMLIDLSFSNLHFNVDLKDINNDGIILYKKCKFVLAYSSLLNSFHLMSDQLFFPLQLD